MLKQHRKIILEIARKLRKTMEAEHGSCLGGFCREASIRLFKKLKQKNFQAKLIIGHVKLELNCYGEHNLGTHVWLELNQCYIDLTGDQFNHPNIRKIFPKVFIEAISRCPRYFKEKSHHDLNLFDLDSQNYDIG